MSVFDELAMKAKAKSDAALLPGLLDQLIIWAVRIGFRDDSTPEEQRLGEALMAVHERWLEVKPQ